MRPGSTGPLPLPPGAMAPRTGVLPPLPDNDDDDGGRVDVHAHVGLGVGGKSLRPTSMPVTSPSVQEQPPKPWMYF